MWLLETAHLGPQDAFWKFGRAEMTEDYEDTALQLAAKFLESQGVASSFAAHYENRVLILTGLNPES